MTMISLATFGPYGGGTRGTKLVSDMPFALYFSKYRTEMVYCKRTWGIDLGWYRKTKCGGWKAILSGKLFGINGTYSRDGLTGKAFVKLRDYLCAKAIKSAGEAGSGLEMVKCQRPFDGKGRCPDHGRTSPVSHWRFCRVS